MENVLVYNEATETIRQMPQNYLIAHRKDKAWICEPDLAADRGLANRVFNALFEHKLKYGTGLELLAEVTPNFIKEEGAGDEMTEAEKVFFKLGMIILTKKQENEMVYGDCLLTLVDLKGLVIKLYPESDKDGDIGHIYSELIDLLKQY